jgi:hypothetical protein
VWWSSRQACGGGSCSLRSASGRVVVPARPRDLAASDYSPATLRSYGFDLLRRFRFLYPRFTAWERADRLDVREFVEWLREAPNRERLRRRADAPPPGSVNPITGKQLLPAKYASRTINHQLSVLFGFYEFACSTDLGPMLNPVPAQRSRTGERLYAHHHPMDDFVVHRRATYRQKVPKPVWRVIPDEAANAAHNGVEITSWRVPTGRANRCGNGSP